MRADDNLKAVFDRVFVFRWDHKRPYKDNKMNLMSGGVTWNFMVIC